MVEKIKGLMQAVNTLKKTKQEKEDAEAILKAEIAYLDDQIKLLSQDLLTELTIDNQKVFVWEEADLVAEKFTKEAISYTSDSDVLQYLKENYNGQYIKTKISEALDKNALKKAIKADVTLASALEAMTVKTKTEYVVVTTSEKHALMLEHINAARS